MKQSHKLTDHQKIEIVEKYQTGNYTCVQLAELYSVCKSSIARLLHRRNIPVNNNQSQLQRKYSLDESYFNVIDTEEKAYFLGFIYADAYHDVKRGILTINLQERDKQILERFKSLLDFGGPLHFKEYKSKHPTWQDQYSLVIASPLISASLLKLGVIQCKSFTLQFPTNEQIPSSLIRHFIRGYFDGDGSSGMYTKKNGGVQFDASIIGNTDFIKSLKILLELEVGVNFQIINHHTTKGIINIKTNGRNQVFKFLHWLYDDSTIHLERKYNYLSKYAKSV